MARRTERAKIAEKLRRQGFDKSYVDPVEKLAQACCSQCNALVVNGVPTHERGCPNDKSS
jgi:hypothetical protein